MFFSRKLLVICCLTVLLAGMVPAETREVSTQNETKEVTARNWGTEFDITFWQTVPLAVFWSYAVASQAARGGEINWSPVLNCSALISLANAGWQASRVGR